MITVKTVSSTSAYDFTTSSDTILYKPFAVQTNVRKDSCLYNHKCKSFRSA